MMQGKHLPMDADQRRKLFEDGLYDAAWLWWYGQKDEAKELLYRITLRAVPERVRYKPKAGESNGQAEKQNVDERGA